MCMRVKRKKREERKERKGKGVGLIAEKEKDGGKEKCRRKEK